MDGSQIKTDYPVVLRFEGLYPHHLAGYEAHRLRKGGDLNHVDRARSNLNQRLIGPEDWAALALKEINEMTAENFAAELESLEKRNRKKDIERRIIEGPKQPWRPTRHGPIREVILTVNKNWFEGDLSAFFGETENRREKEFGELAVAWLKDSFGDDVIHARADRDEAAYHIHAVIMPRATVEIAKPKAKVSTATATRRMLQPSIHPLIENYEAAQDSVGLWFADLGLVRGERTADAIRKARGNGTKPPKRRYHAKTWKWRVKEELRLKAEAKVLAEKQALLDERTEQVAQREDEAETVLAVAEGVATGAFIADHTGEGAGLVEAPARGHSTSPDSNLEVLRQRSPAGFTRAAGVFGRAWARLFGYAHERAEADAAAGVSDAMQQIAEADQLIVDAAGHLPQQTRTLIASIRRKIPAMLRTLERSATLIPEQPNSGRPKPGQEEKL